MSRCTPPTRYLEAFLTRLSLLENSRNKSILDYLTISESREATIPEISEIVLLVNYSKNNFSKKGTGQNCSVCASGIVMHRTEFLGEVAFYMIGILWINWNVVSDMLAGVKTDTLLELVFLDFGPQMLKNSLPILSPILN